MILNLHKERESNNVPTTWSQSGSALSFPRPKCCPFPSCVPIPFSERFRRGQAWMPKRCFFRRPVADRKQFPHSFLPPSLLVAARCSQLGWKWRSKEPRGRLSGGRTSTITIASRALMTEDGDVPTGRKSPHMHLCPATPPPYSLHLHQNLLLTR